MRMSHRKGKDLRRIRLIWICLFIAVLAACAVPSVKRPVPGAGPVDNPSLFSKASADGILLNEGISWLGSPDVPADYAQARASFETLLSRYPASRWRFLAETFIRLLDDLQAARSGMQSDLERIKSENERLHHEIRSLNDRFQAEHASLLQENEKLRQDMELLKKLEVQLDRREKMLR